LTVLLLAVPASAADTGASKSGKKAGAPKLDLGVRSFEALPKAEQVEKPKPVVAPAAEAKALDTAYTLVRVVHGKGFIRSPDGARPTSAMTQVLVTGSPLETERFSTVVRVKNPAKRSARVEVAIVDSRGDTAMEASGELLFKGVETEWSVDWEPTTVRAAGEFQVQVKVSGDLLGSFPIKFADPGT
jgi:hypothetical protein